MIGPAFSHAADTYNLIVFLKYEIPEMESVLACLFIICASKKHASKNTLFQL